MPQVDFFFSDDEMIAFASHLVGLGFQFVPDSYYDNPDSVRLDNLEDIRHWSSTEPKFFLLRGDITQGPLVWWRLSGGPNDGKYYVAQRYGGATMDLFWSGVQELDGRHFIRPGNLAYYGAFIDPETSCEIRAPKVLRQAYRQLKMWIDSNSIESENPPGLNGRPLRPVRIGRQAAEEWKKGMPLGPPEDQSRRPRVVAS
jgi:hypothetical protein